MLNFTEAVKAAMDAQGINVPTLAKTTGYTPQHIYDLLKGDRRWNEDVLVRVFEALSIEIEVKEATE